MRFETAVALALLAQAVSSSAIPNPLLGTPAIKIVSSLDTSPDNTNSLTKRETQVREREAHPLLGAPIVEVVPSLDTSPAPDARSLEKREKRVLSIMLQEWHSHRPFEDKGHLHLDWLFFTVQPGNHANCTSDAVKGQNGFVKYYDSLLPGIGAGQLSECPAGDYRLPNLYGDGKYNDQACRYKCNGEKGNTGAVWCGTTFISQCKQELARVNYTSAEHLPIDCGGDDHRLPYVV
jgi:hypothetical protein